MRPINVTLDSQTWEWAKRKTNFSEWVRQQLHYDEKGPSIEALIAQAEEMYEQKEYWYQKYAALRKEMEMKQ